MLSKEDAAKLLGMASREVVDIHAAGDGATIVVTHDGYPTLVTADGELVFGPTAIGERLAGHDAPPADGGPASAAHEPDADADPAAGGGAGGSGDGVPAGSVDEVLRWVGDDRDKAGQALAAERGRERPRTGVTAPLEKLLTAQPGATQ
jgi:hypothetical protein